MAKWLTVREMADKFETSIIMVQLAIHKAELIPTELGGKMCYNSEEVKQWIP